MMQHSAENKGGKNKQSKMPNLKKRKETLLLHCIGQSVRSCCIIAVLSVIKVE